MMVLRTLLASLLVLAAGFCTLAATTDGFRAFTAQAAHRIDVREHPRAVPPIPLQTARGQAINFAACTDAGCWLISSTRAAVHTARCRAAYSRACSNAWRSR